MFFVYRSNCTWVYNLMIYASIDNIYQHVLLRWSVSEETSILTAMTISNHLKISMYTFFYHIFHVVRTTKTVETLNSYTHWLLQAKFVRLLCQNIDLAHSKYMTVALYFFFIKISIKYLIADFINSELETTANCSWNWADSTGRKSS